MSEKIPENWEIKRLGDFLISLSKSKLQSGLSDETGYYNFYVCSQKVLKSFYKEMSSSAVLLSTGGEAAVHYAKGEYSYSTDVWAINFSGEIYDEYVFRIIEKDLERINYKGFQGSGIKHLDKKFINKLTYVFPPLYEQKKIVSILNSVDDVIKNTQKHIQKLQDLKKGIMNELLTKGIGHTKFKDSKLGRIPKSWNVKMLSEITSKIGDGIHSTPNYSDTGIFPFINGNNLVNGKIHFDQSTKRVDKNEFEKHNTNLEKETLLLSINGTIGNLAFYKGERVVLGKSAAYLTFKPNFFLPFAFYLLNSDKVKKQFENNSTGTTINNLSLQSIRNMPVQVPSIPEQQKISKAISSVDVFIQKIQNKLAQTQILKKSLMQDLLTGKVRAKVN